MQQNPVFKIPETLSRSQTKKYRNVSTQQFSHRSTLSRKASQTNRQEQLVKGEMR